MSVDDRSHAVLVTGGAGFLGRAIVDDLLDDGARVRVLDRHIGEPLPTGVDVTEGDVTDRDTVLAAADGVDAIIHAASIVDWGQVPTATLEAVNVGGVRVVIDVARTHGIGALVHTSTMDVVCGNEPVVDADESTPFPRTFTNEYSRTKAEGERIALAADDDRLRVTALRPCGMYGERDPYHLANVLRLVRAGKLPLRLGDGSARFQHVYVRNVAHAHVLAVHDLLSDAPRTAGNAYFVTDDSPAIDFLDHLEPIIEALGERLPPRNRHLPEPIALGIGAAMEALAAVTERVPFVPTFQPTLTRSSVRFVCHDHTFDGSALRRDLGYRPPHDHDEAMRRTIAWWRAHDADAAHA